MKKIALIVLSAVILFAAPSCKKQDCKLVKHVVSEEYVYAEPCADQPQVVVVADNQKDKKTEKKDKLPKLWKCQARALTKDVLTDSGIINTPRVVPMAIGYYECNEVAKRELLYKAQVNGLLDVTYSEIKNHNSAPTYWVNVALTSKGKALIVDDDAPIHPEDTISEDYIKEIISPNSGLNKYGEYTFDYDAVPADVKELIVNFYRVYINGKNEAIAEFGTPDLILAQSRILKAKELGIRKRVVDHFTRNVNFTAQQVEELEVCKWTCFVDLYVATINGHQYCLVVKEVDGVKKIDDVALGQPSLVQLMQTLRCYAMNITARELHDAQKLADVRPSRPQRLDPVAPSVSNAPAAPLLFDEYAPVLLPGLEQVIRPERIPYDEACDLQYTDTFDILAYNKKLTKMGRLKDVKGAAVVTKKADIVIKTVKVSPLGRICYEEVDGVEEEYVAYFQYIDEEWICIAVHEKEDVKAIMTDPCVVVPAAPVQTQIVPVVTNKLDDNKCECAN